MHAPPAMRQPRQIVLSVTLAALCPLWLFCASGPLSEPQEQKHTRTSPSTNEITPGTGVGPIQLGDSKDRILTHFRLKPNIDEEITREGCGVALTEIHWLDIDLHQNGIWFYVHSGIVFQIRSSTSRFHTKRGITADSTADLVQRNYSNLSAFKLVSSGNQATGWKDHIYWVGKSSGIGFELYYNEDSSQWRVQSIFVFRPGTEFLPAGCVDPPQEWKGIPPYTF
jgi:hypothetical protein